MPSIDHFVAKFTNSNVDAANYQLVDFDCDLIASGMDPQDAAARLVCYFFRCAEANVIATGTQLVEIMYTAPGAPGGTPLVFPALQIPDVTSVSNASPYNWAIAPSAYGTMTGGAGNLCPLGTSVSVSERTGTAGPTGRGRHFLPYIGQEAVNTGGTLGSGQITDVHQAYNLLFLGLPGLASSGPNLDELHPCVTNALRTTEHPILLVKPQPVFSNLESRRR